MFLDDSQPLHIFSESSTDFVSTSLESFKKSQLQPHPKFSKYFDMLKKVCLKEL